LSILYPKLNKKYVVFDYLQLPFDQPTLHPLATSPVPGLYFLQWSWSDQPTLHPSIQALDFPSFQEILS